MYDHVLVPTDGEQPASLAADHAIALAAAFDAQVHVLYVLKPNEPAPDVEDPPAKEDPDTKGDRAVEEIATRVEQEGLDAVRSIVRGQTVDAILTYIEENDIDVVVMGTHGRTGLDRLVLGSIAEKVTRQAPVPVMTCRPPED